VMWGSFVGFESGPSLTVAAGAGVGRPAPGGISVGEATDGPLRRMRPCVAVCHGGGSGARGAGDRSTPATRGSARHPPPAGRRRPGTGRRASGFGGWMVKLSRTAPPSGRAHDEELHVRRSLGRTSVDRDHGSGRQGTAPPWHTADVLTVHGAGVGHRDGGAGGHRSPPSRHHLPDPDWPPRPPRRPGRQAAGTASVRGAFFDSDHRPHRGRRPDVRLRWYLLDRGKATSALLPMAILAVTALISYDGPRRSRSVSRPRVPHGAGRSAFSCSVVAFLSSVIFVPVLWVMLVLVSSPRSPVSLKVWQRGVRSRPGDRPSHRGRREGRSLALAGLGRGSPGRRCPAVSWPGPRERRSGAGGPAARRPEQPLGRTLRERRRADRGHDARRSTGRRTPPAA